MDVGHKNFSKWVSGMSLWLVFCHLGISPLYSTYGSVLSIILRVGNLAHLHGQCCKEERPMNLFRESVDDAFANPTDDSTILEAIRYTCKLTSSQHRDSQLATHNPLAPELRSDTGADPKQRKIKWKKGKKENPCMITPGITPGLTFAFNLIPCCIETYTLICPGCRRRLGLFQHSSVSVRVAQTPSAGDARCWGVYSSEGTAYVQFSTSSSIP